jgi:putative hydrolases of HD superfamily
MEDIVKFFFEAGQLQRVHRSGWWLINIKNPEKVSDHIYRSCIIAYILAKLEKADENKVLKISLLHDIHESRLNDLHKVGHKYIDFRSAEDIVFKDQMKLLPDNISKEILKLFEENGKDKTKEGIVVRDADLLDNSLSAREYLYIGYKDAQNWLDNISRALKTESAKKLFNIIIKMNPNEWWYGLKKAER